MPPPSWCFFILGHAWHCLSTVFLVFLWFGFPLCCSVTPYLGSVLSSFLWYVRTILAFSSVFFVLLSLFVRASHWWLRFLFFGFLRYPIFLSTSSSLPQVFFVHLLSWVSSILIRIMPAFHRVGFLLPYKPVYRPDQTGMDRKLFEHTERPFGYWVRPSPSPSTPTHNHTHKHTSSLIATNV